MQSHICLRFFGLIDDPVTTAYQQAAAGRGTRARAALALRAATPCPWPRGRRVHPPGQRRRLEVHRSQHSAQLV
jgi:hypothetical protein